MNNLVYAYMYACIDRRSNLNKIVATDKLNEYHELLILLSTYTVAT